MATYNLGVSGGAIRIIPIEQDHIRYIRVNPKDCNLESVRKIYPWIKHQTGILVRCDWEWENDDEFDRFRLTDFPYMSTNEMMDWRRWMLLYVETTKTLPFPMRFVLKNKFKPFSGDTLGF